VSFAVAVVAVVAVAVAVVVVAVVELIQFFLIVNNANAEKDHQQ
jgi:cytochrome c-type biogenesis protein CcmE